MGGGLKGEEVDRLRCRGEGLVWGGGAGRETGREDQEEGKQEGEAGCAYLGGLKVWEEGRRC